MTKSSAVIPQAQQQQIFNAFRMMRLPEIKPAANFEAASFG